MVSLFWTFVYTCVAWYTFYTQVYGIYKLLTSVPKGLSERFLHSAGLSWRFTITWRGSHKNQIKNLFARAQSQIQIFVLAGFRHARNYTTAPTTKREFTLRPHLIITYKEELFKIWKYFKLFSVKIKTYYYMYFRRIRM